MRPLVHSFNIFLLDSSAAHSSSANLPLVNTVMFHVNKTQGRFGSIMAVNRATVACRRSRNLYQRVALLSGCAVPLLLPPLPAELPGDPKKKPLVPAHSTAVPVMGSLCRPGASKGLDD